MIVTNKNKAYYISGIKAFNDTNNAVTFIFFKNDFNREDENLQIVIKVKKIYKELELYNKFYIGNIIGVETTKTKEGKDIVIVSVDDIKIDYSSLVYEDYAEYIDNSPDIWYSPF